MIKAFKFRLYPTEDQEVLLNKHFGCTRFIYNWALNYKTQHYAETKKNINWKYLSASDDYFTLKDENDWLKEVNSQSLISAIGNLDRAYKNFFEGRADFPKHKKRKQKQTFQVPQHGSIDQDNGLLHIPKFKDGIKCNIHRPIPEGKLGTFTVEKRPSGRYFVSVLVHLNVGAPKKVEPKNAIGLDFGLKTFITTSEGEKIKSPKFFKQNKRKLKKASRKHSKAKKGGKNREKCRLKLAKIHERIANQRKNFLHQTSHRIVNDSQIDTICIEDLNLKGMLKLWGCAISDVSWFEFTRQLQYKCDWAGKNLIKIGRFDPSTILCNHCGFINRDLTLKDRRWTCPSCGTEHDRDFNAANNIRDFGMNQYRLGQELSDVTPLEEKALAKKRKPISETGSNELGEKRVYVLRTHSKPNDL